MFDHGKYTDITCERMTDIAQGERLRQTTERLRADRSARSLRRWTVRIALGSLVVTFLGAE